MDFFVPLAKSFDQAQSVYLSIAEHVSAPTPTNDKRIQKLVWTHEGVECIGEIGQLPPEVFRANDEILAIFECDNVYKICTQNRGVINFDPILASRDTVKHITYFD
ncbi:hypothetical protein [uncultured Photobacterium sp.]|uniref:hypothetical protein n=1 Tax=uncultured Photobacterium sp. TaxID=173973 RepID=UPI00262E080E|nr:hypothetical protein [uncultured Photobacterium sp.]